MEPVSVLTMIQGSFSILKSISEVLKKGREIDEAMLIVEIREQMLELQESLVNVKEQTIELMQENQELWKRLQVNNELQHDEDGNILWRVQGDKKSGPYCSTCYGVGEKLISLSKSEDSGSWYCPQCKNRFHTQQWYKEQHQKHEYLRREFYR